MNRVFIFLFFGLAVSRVISQNVLDHRLTDLNKEIEAIHDLADGDHPDFAQAILRFEKVRSTLPDSNFLKFKLYKSIGIVFFKQGNYHSAIKWLDSSLFYCHNVYDNDNIQAILASNYLARANIYTNDFIKAEELLKINLFNLLKVSDTINLVSTHDILAECYFVQERYDEAKAELTKSNLLINGISESDNIVATHNRFSVYFYSLNKQYGKALIYNNKLVKNMHNKLLSEKECNDMYMQGWLLDNLFKFNESVEFHSKAINCLINKHGLKSNRIFNLLLNYSNVLVQIKDNYSADSIFNFIQKNIVKCLSDCDKEEYTNYLGTYIMACTKHLELQMANKDFVAADINKRIIDSLIMDTDLEQLFGKHELKIFYSILAKYSAFKDFSNVYFYLEKIFNIYSQELEQKLNTFSEEEMRNFQINSNASDLNLFFSLYNKSIFDDSYTSILYDICLYSKGIGLRKLRNTNLALDVVEKSKNGKLEEDVVLSKDLIKSNSIARTIQERKNSIAILSQRIKNVSTNSNLIDHLKLRECLKQNDVAVEFYKYNGQYSYEDSSLILKPIYVALVLSKKFVHPLFIPLLDEFELDKLLNGNGSSRLNSEIGYLDRGHGLGLKPVKPEMNSLYNAVWKPILDKFDTLGNIYFSPTGLLMKLNLGALEIENNVYVSDKYNLVQMNSIATIGNMAKDSSFNIVNALIVGNVNYDFKIKLSETNRTEHWQMLKGTLDEVNSIQSIFEQNSGFVDSLTQDNATEAYFCKAITNKRYDLIHIATHGYYSPIKEQDEANYDDDPMVRNGIVLAGANWSSDNTANDGYLSAREICSLKFDSNKLVILSTCNSGSGQQLQNNEGVYGLHRALKIAGAGKLLLSLWPVPDEPTKELFEEFYKELVLKKEEPNTAFKKAQNIIRNKYNQYFWWAGFVLIN